ncbi:MAG: hypothetical protein ABIO16_11165 [Nocardioides sp.]
MSRRAHVDLTTPRQDWRPVPMPGANGDIELVPLACAPGRFTILGRVPPGFERLTLGGYRCSEEFLVVDGELEFERTTYVRGDLTVVPAHLLRTGMRSPRGCVLLAWFGGPAIFQAPDELDLAVGAIVSARTSDRSEPLPGSPVGAWIRGPAVRDGVVDVVDPELGSWQRGPADAAAGALVRQDLAGDAGSAS